MTVLNTNDLYTFNTNNLITVNFMVSVFYHNLPLMSLRGLYEENTGEGFNTGLNASTRYMMVVGGIMTGNPL